MLYVYEVKFDGDSETHFYKSSKPMDEFVEYIANLTLEKTGLINDFPTDVIIKQAEPTESFQRKYRFDLNMIIISLGKVLITQ